MGSMTLRLRPLNECAEKWSDFDSDYFVGDDGYIYRRLHSSYYRKGRKHLYQQVRNSFGTDKQHTVHVHRAVALAYLGDRPEGANDVDHKNNDKEDNRAENLQWLTHKANCVKRIADSKKGEAV